MHCDVRKLTGSSPERAPKCAYSRCSQRVAVPTIRCCSSTETAHCLAAKLPARQRAQRRGLEELLLSEIERQQKLGKEVVFRADAAFAKPEIYEALESRGVKYAIRIPANENLERDVAELLPRPVGRPSHRPIVWYKSFLYKAASWTTARRVVAKAEHHAGELFPCIGFIVTNLETPSRAVVRFYNKRGRAEQWIKEGKQAVKMTRLSCHRFRSNEVRLWLSVLAYNLGNLWRRLCARKSWFWAGRAWPPPPGRTAFPPGCGLVAPAPSACWIFAIPPRPKVNSAGSPGKSTLMNSFPTS